MAKYCKNATALMIVGMTIGDKKIVSKIPFTLLPDFQNQRLTIVPSTQAITTLTQAIFTLKIKELRNSDVYKRQVLCSGTGPAY